MRARISGVLGDPKKVIGPDWAYEISQRFTRADFACAQAISQSRAPASYVGVLQEAGKFLAAEQGQWVVAASTMERLLAHFLKMSMRSRRGPDEVRRDRLTGKIELLCRGVLLAELYAFSPLPVSNYALDRAEAILFGVHEIGGKEQLHDRLGAWLPLSYTSVSYGRERLHIPSAAGWLHAACQLAGRHGLHDGSHSLDERLAGAVLGVPWPLLALNRTAVAEASGPWYLRRENDGAGSLEIYSSPLHASAMLLDGLSTGRFFPRSTVGLRIEETAVGYPAMTFHDPMPDDGAVRAEDSYEQVSVGPCGTINPSEKWTARAARALQTGDARSIELAFGAYWTREERLHVYDSYYGQRLLAQSGNWRFTVNATGAPEVLHAHRIDSTGRSVIQATVRKYCGYLLRFRHFSEYVLTAFWMREPVAVIDGIEKSTAQIVSDFLGGELEVRHSWRALDLDGRRHVKFLMEAMDERRAAEASAGVVLSTA